MQKLFTSDVFLTAELVAASGARPSQIEAWCRLGILLPYKQSNGFGSRRLFKGAIPILDATEARDLTVAGYSHKQILRRFAVQRAALVSLSPDAALVQRFKFYIATIVQLAHLFGPGPGFETWLATQQAQLKRMEKALTRAGDEGTRGPSTLNLLAAAVPEDDAPQALAG
jgi:hypothetical protein